MLSKKNLLSKLGKRVIYLLGGANYYRGHALENSKMLNEHFKDHLKFNLFYSLQDVKI